MKNYLIVLMLFSCIQNSIQAQVKCERLLEWTKVAKVEFPDVSFNKVVVGSSLYNKVLYNLYSDKYFVPIFGKPFDEISVKDRNSIYMQLRKCSVQGKYSEELSWEAGTLLHPLAESGFGDYPSSKVLNKIQEFRKLREQYNSITVSVKNSNNSSKELENYLSVLNNDLSILFPSEIKMLKDLILMKLKIQAEKELTQILNSELSKSPSYESFVTHFSFKEDNHILFNYLDDGVKNQINSKIQSNLSTIVKNLMTAELLKVNALKADGSSIESINYLIASFRSKYLYYFKYDQISSAFSSFESKKTKIISSIYPKIKEKIGSIQSIPDLNKFEDEYLSNTLSTDISIVELYKLLNNRKIAIEKQLEEKRIADDLEKRMQSASQYERDHVHSPNGNIIIPENKKRPMCNKCNGRGQLQVSSRERCYNCSGTGSVGFGRSRRACYSCTGGYNYQSKQVVCSSCNGSGYGSN